MPFQKTIKLQNCIFQIPAQLLLLSLIDSVPKYFKEGNKKFQSGHKMWSWKIQLRSCEEESEEGKQLIMVQLFYYENHGKCCKNLWKHDGKKLKVRKLSLFLNVMKTNLDGWNWKSYGTGAWYFTVCNI